MITIAVLLGGVSSERTVSIASGKECSKALLKLGFAVREVDITSTDFETIKTQLTPPPDIVFNALHGTFGEDGGIQHILNTLHIPYTHSSVKSSRLCMDKHATITMYKKHAIPALQHVYTTASDICQDTLPFKRPFVIKPSNNGSSIGLHIIKEHTPFPDLKNWKWGKIIIEPYVTGLELTVSVLNGKALCVTELIPKTGVYTYDAKYQQSITKHICPANIDTKLTKELLKYAQKAHAILGCHVISRTDFRYDPTTHTIATLETNTQPGMTRTSLVPEQARSVGINFEELVHILVKSARTYDD